MIKKILKGCVACFTVIVSAAIQADESIATLSKINGMVLIDQDGFYRSVRPGSKPALRSGDRVLALNNSSADIVYENACVLHLPANRILTLASLDECVLGIAQVESAQSIESGGGASADTSEDGNNDLLRAALISAAVGASIYLATQDDDDDPVSPE